MARGPLVEFRKASPSQGSRDRFVRSCLHDGSFFAVFFFYLYGPYIDALGV